MTEEKTAYQKWQACEPPYTDEGWEWQRPEMTEEDKIREAELDKEWDVQRTLIIERLKQASADNPFYQHALKYNRYNLAAELKQLGPNHPKYQEAVKHGWDPN